jgi:hypothetical protein
VYSLSADEALTHPGSLLSTDGEIVASYDLARQDKIGGVFRPLASASGIHHAAAHPFRLSYRDVPAVHVVNGIGVALGDAVLGLTAIEALRLANPALRCLLYRPSRTPAHTDGLYRLAADRLTHLRTLPYALRDLPARERVIDLGNHVYWPQFATLPMIDFFLWALGADPAAVPSEAKRNGWLKRLRLPAPAPRLHRSDYVLFCPSASTPIRSIPTALRRELVERLWRTHGVPVVGFEPIDHPRYVDARVHSPDTGSFLAWVKHARFVLSADTSAVHIAAGFDVPTTALFTTIKPALRVRDYPLCKAVAIDVPGLDGLHESSDARDLALLHSAYHGLSLQDLPLSIDG